MAESYGVRLLRIFSLTAFCVPAIFAPDGWALTINQALMIWFHEAGHAVFGVFAESPPYGTALMFFGGSLMQLLVPTMFTGVVFAAGKRFDAALMCLWIGLNAFAVGYYCADAKARALPLIFGMDKGLHDWWNIELFLGLGPWHGWLVAFWWALGLACYAVAVVGGLYVAPESD